MLLYPVLNRECNISQESPLILNENKHNTIKLPEKKKEREREGKQCVYFRVLYLCITLEDHKIKVYNTPITRNSFT